MRFILVHKTVTYLMVLTSTLSIPISGELSPWAAPFFLVAMAASWFWEAPRVSFKRFELAWNIVSVAALGKVVVEVLSDRSLLSSGMGFILFLMVNKLYNRKSSRDYLQLYVLSFMQLIAGSTVDVDITYGLQFILYIVFGTWTLILFHLGAVVAWRVMRSRRSKRPGGAGRRSGEAADALYHQLLTTYARLGMNRSPNVTAREFLALLQKREAPEQGLAAEVVSVYEESRFGGWRRRGMW